MREFVVTDKHGLPVCRASSAWLLLDAGSFRPKKIETLGSVIPKNEEKPCLVKNLPKIEPGECAKMFTQQIRPSAIDLNGHLNNAEYFALAQDALAGPFTIREIRMNFVSDLKAGDTVAVFAGNGSPADTYYAEGRNESGSMAFQAEMVVR